nr:hypothetical protein CFP56_04571 [Quercus suber]POE63678.1 hypothetical protein CFP56_04581 [Quercus suber]
MVPSYTVSEVVAQPEEIDHDGDSSPRLTWRSAHCWSSVSWGGSDTASTQAGPYNSDVQARGLAYSRDAVRSRWSAIGRMVVSWQSLPTGHLLPRLRTPAVDSPRGGGRRHVRDCSLREQSSSQPASRMYVQAGSRQSSARCGAANGEAAGLSPPYLRKLAMLIDQPPGTSSLGHAIEARSMQSSLAPPVSHGRQSRYTKHRAFGCKFVQNSRRIENGGGPLCGLSV